MPFFGKSSSSTGDASPDVKKEKEKEKKKDKKKKEEKEKEKEKEKKKAKGTPVEPKVEEDTRPPYVVSRLHHTLEIANFVCPDINN